MKELSWSIRKFNTLKKKKPTCEYFPQNGKDTGIQEYKFNISSLYLL